MYLYLCHCFGALLSYHIINFVKNSMDIPVFEWVLSPLKLLSFILALFMLAMSLNDFFKT